MSRASALPTKASTRWITRGRGWVSFETPRLVCVVVTRTAAPIPFAKRVMTLHDLNALRRLIAENLVPSPEALAAMRDRRIAHD